MQAYLDAIPNHSILSRTTATPQASIAYMPLTDEVETYYDLASWAALYDLMDRLKIPTKRLICGTTLSDSDDETIQFWLIEGPTNKWIDIPTPEFTGKLAEKLAKLFRHRKDLGELSPDASGEQVDWYIGEIRQLYLSLTDYINRHRERLLRASRQLDMTRCRIERNADQRAELRGQFTEVPSNFLDIIPHMPVLKVNPEMDKPLSIVTTGQGAEALALQRPVSQSRTYRDLEFAVIDDDLSKDTLLNSVQTVFVAPNVSWLLPQGYVGLFQMAEENGTLNTGYDTATTAADFWKTLRPDKVERIASRGTTNILGENLDPRELFFAFMNVARRINIPFSGLRNKGQERIITGIIQVSAVDIRNGQPHCIHWRINPQLASYITGEGQKALYMVTNRQAMFGYRRKALHTAPALQLYIELRLRTTYRNLGTTELETPNGNGTRVETILHALGLGSLINGLTPKKAAIRIFTSLDQVAEAGVIADWSVEIPSPANPLGELVKIKGSNDYAVMYKSLDLKRDKRILVSELEKPGPRKKPKN